MPLFKNVSNDIYGKNKIRAYGENNRDDIYTGGAQGVVSNVGRNITKASSKILTKSEKEANKRRAEHQQQVYDLMLNDIKEYRRQEREQQIQNWLDEKQVFFDVNKQSMYLSFPEEDISLYKKCIHRIYRIIA